jgi:drug/metabolite transporter (DMT)-like permease
MASFYIVIAIFIWSSLGIIVRLADTDIINIIFFPSLIALITQSIILFATVEQKNIPRPAKIPSLFMLGPVFLMNHFLFFYAFTHTTIGNAVLTHYTAPVFVAVLAPFILKESTDKVVVISILISSAGLLLLLKGFSFSEQHLAGITAGTLSGLTYAFIIMIGRFLAKNYRPLIITLFQNLTVVAILLPFIISKGHIPMKSMGYFFLMGIVHSTAAPLLYIRGLKEVRANKASILGYLEPVGAMLLALLVLSEIPRVMSLIGGILIILSGYIILKRD